MWPCPRCQIMPAWKLGDGRFKCHSCGTRYKWRSVWDSIRLPDATKDRLLNAFVHGVPVYRQRFDDGACSDSRERFYRLARACCAVEQAVSPSAAAIVKCGPADHRASRYMRGWARTDEIAIIGLALEGTTVRVATPDFCAVGEIVALLRERVAVGGVYCTREDFGFANLQVHGNYAVLPSRASEAMSPGFIEEFWKHARQRLQSLRKIPTRFLPLYLGEMSFRFNHCEHEQAVVLRHLLHTLSMQQIQPLLGERAGGAHRVANGAIAVGPDSPGITVQFGPAQRPHIGIAVGGD